jgi:phage tail-like protein
MTTMALGQKLTSKISGGALGSYPSYGMTMRFSVTVDDLSLGLWRSCKGLEVKLTYKTFEEGGGYQGDVSLPEKLVYSNVTLERGIEQSDSQALQTWLKGYIAGWQTYPLSAGGSPPATSVTIQLLDYQLNPVMDWTLTDARPTRWTGPSMNATDNGIAIETLEFEHAGFL